MHRGSDDPWSAFVKDLQQRTPPDDVDAWHRLVAALDAVQPTVTVADQVGTYQLWAPRISRFSFTLTAIPHAPPAVR